MDKPTINEKFKMNQNILMIGPLLLFFPVLLISDSFYGIFGADNYVGIHLIMEILIIVVSLSIAVQSWIISPYIMTNKRLYIGALFFSIGILELAHTMFYKGMPQFITDGNPYYATWLYMVSRLTQAIGLLVILTLKKSQITRYHRWIAYSIALVYAFVWILIVNSPIKFLPDLVIEGQGTTDFKNTLQYTAIFIQISLIIYLLKTLHVSKTRNVMIIFASVYLILSDVMFTTYTSVYDIRNFVGHIFQLLGFYFLIRALYHSSVEKPFKELLEIQEELEHSVISLEETKMELEYSKEELHYMAYHDELTGLTNSRSLFEKLKHELHHNHSSFALLVIEVDRLQYIRESIGLSFSNIVLKEVANRLKDKLPPDVYISKLREGEYTIVMDDVRDKQQIVSLCLEIQEQLRTPIQVKHLSLKIKVNIGIVYNSDRVYTVENLLKNAQAAMRESRTLKCHYAFYEDSMEKELLETIMLEQDLHYAIEKNEIYLQYQPKVNVKTGEIHSVEALVRWNHGKRGFIPPDIFIPLAEQSGLIIPIGEWILEKSCEQIKEWHNMGYSNLKLAVNLSIRQFYQQDLIEMIQRVLQKTGLEADYLELEITESMTMNTKHAIQVLNKLKCLDLSIAIDDFGTGYSSLSYLKDFPIDCLKIDRSFVKNIASNDQGNAIIGMIISMAKYLNLKVVAEGVEELTQLSFLRNSHCDIIQGYLFSKPLLPEQLSAEFINIQENAKSILESLE